MTPIAYTVLEVLKSLPPGRIRLATLRGALDGEIARPAQDKALLDLQAMGRIVLYRDDNTPGLTSADRAAALHIAGNPRHLVYLT